MINEKLTFKNKDRLVNRIFNNYKSSREFSSEDYARLKLIKKITKLEELKDIDKIYEYQESIYNSDNKPSYNFMRQDSKCFNNDYIPKTNYGYKNRNKKFSTLFKRNLNLNLFTQNKKKKIEKENIFPTDFEEINEEIELKKMENNSMNKYLINEDTNKLNNKDNYSNYIKISKANSNNLISKFRKDIYQKCVTEPNLILEEENSKRNSEIKRINKSAKRVSAFLVNRNIINLKLSNKKICGRNDNNNINSNLSNYTTAFRSFSVSQPKDNNIKEIINKKEEKKLNSDSFYNRINSSTYREEYKMTPLEIKTSRDLMNRIINDGFVIDKYIKSNRLNLRKDEKKKNKEEILLKLEQRIKLRNNKKLKIKKDKKKEKKLTDEELFQTRLVKMPRFAKKFFREIYKKILFENRVLNKIEVYNIDNAMEKLNLKKKLMKETKKDTTHRMRLAKDNLITEKDDKALINEQKKQFDFYGNLDGLEWLLMKKNIIKKYH